MMRSTLTTFLIFFVLSQPAKANEAQDFFKKYNEADTDVKMVCKQGNGSLVTLTAKNGFVFLDNVATDQTQTSKNGDKEQYYIRGGIWDLVADFENKILIHIKNGEEFLRDKCKRADVVVANLTKKEGHRYVTPFSIPHITSVSIQLTCTKTLNWSFHHSQLRRPFGSPIASIG